MKLLEEAGEFSFTAREVFVTLVSRDHLMLTPCLFLQILVYEGEMARAQGQLEAEMQNLEEEKNRVIEEAFIRAESEMKAVHENLAGQMWHLPRRFFWL